MEPYSPNSKELVKLSNQYLIRFPGSGSVVSGNTPFGFYDSDITFQKDCYNAMIWAARMLGYPSIAIELRDIQFYAAFEEATNVYNAKVNEYNMLNNMFTLQGQRITSLADIQNRNIIGTGLPYMTTLAKDYGTEAGSGGKVRWKYHFIQIQPGVQDYDLQRLLGDVYEKCDGITVRRVFHYGNPAFARIYDPFSMTGMSYSNVLQELGFGSYSPAVQFLMTPIFEDLLRGQAIQFNDLVRKSAYSFEIKDNVLRLLPIPNFGFKTWVEYTNDRETFEHGSVTPIGDRVASDFSNVPYKNHSYVDINDPGRQWIRDYFLALCKEVLGAIRQKHLTIPIPGGEVTLDGAELRSEAQQAKERLLDLLKEQLEQAGKFAQMEKQSAFAEQLQEQLKRVPLLIYVG